MLYKRESIFGPRCALARLLPVVALACLLSRATLAADGEYTGKIEPQLVANADKTEQVIFKPITDLSKIKFATPVEGEAKITAGRLYHALTDKSAILTLLVEPEGDSPYLYADVDMNNVMDNGERFELLQNEEDDNPYILRTVINQPLKEGAFQSYPVIVRYFKNVRWGEMQAGERLILESRGAFARGAVDVAGKKVLVQYEYNPRGKKASATLGKLGVDSDGDGVIDPDPFSGESVEAENETVVFRAGDQYVSTKKVDLEKNLILMKAHTANDYKRVELRIGSVMPDFEFTDFNGKKGRLSQFRGKYLLVDFWGMWCPPCRQELPYLKAAYSRFQARGFEILGMNTDEVEILSQVKLRLKDNGMNWTQAKRESIMGVIRTLRINSFPTTVLLDPEGKVVSVNNTRKGQPSLRGEDLLKSLDRLLEP